MAINETYTSLSAVVDLEALLPFYLKLFQINVLENFEFGAQNG
jgi:hypothetical protein